MSFRNLDANGDWTFGLGQNNYVTDSMEVELNIKTRILSFLGDCFFAQQDGINWWQLLDYGNQEEAEKAVMATIAETEGVESVEMVESIINAQRKLTLSYKYTDVYGVTQENKLLPIV
jgi:hypothetical protein